MEINLNTPEYKRCRGAYVTQCTLEHILGLMVADAFLAKLLSYIGLSDALVGIITSFASVAFVFQLMSIFLVKSKFSTKKMVIFADTVSQTFFMSIYFMPFIPLPDMWKKIIIMAAVMIGQASKCIISSLYFKWANTYVPEKKRAVFSAKKECISLLTGIVFSAVMGWIIDRYESIGSVRGGFLFIATAMLIINVANFISLMMIKDESHEARMDMRVPVKEVIRHIYENKIFLSFALISFLSSISAGFITGFIGIYKTKDLAFSVLTIQIINILADFVRMGVSIPIARYSEKYGYANGIQLSKILSGIGYLVIMFTTPSTRWLIVIFAFLSTATSAASYQNSFNIGYSLLPQKYMTQAMAIKSTTEGILSFVTAVFAGKILSIIQANGNMIFGVYIYAQQLLAFIAFLICIPVIILQKKYVITPLEKLKMQKSS